MQQGTKCKLLSYSEQASLIIMLLAFVAGPTERYTARAAGDEVQSEDNTEGERATSGREKRQCCLITFNNCLLD